MTDVLLGKKFSDKDLGKTMDVLGQELAANEVVVCAVKAIGSRPLINTLVLTNRRLISLYRGRSGEVAFAIPLPDIRRLAFDRHKLLIKTSADETLEVCGLSHDREDGLLIRETFASMGAQLDGDKEIVRNPVADVVASPRTKEKSLRDGLQKVDGYLHDGENVRFALEDIADWYFVTDQRLIVLTGIWKTNAQEMNFADYVRVEVEQDGVKWIVAAVDAQQNYALVGKLNHEHEARWLARCIEETQPHMADAWRDELRVFIDSVGLSYAFEAIFPLLWPGVEGEELLSAFGAGEDLVIFTTRRVAVLPDLVAVPLAHVAEVVFAYGRSEHYSYTGQLAQVAFGLTCNLRIVDGRRWQRVQFIGDSEQRFNQSIPTVTHALEQLRNSGYTLVEGDEWLEQTQSPPPVARQGPTSFVGFSVEF